MDVRVIINRYRKELYNPIELYTREEIIEQLEIARKHVYEGKVMDAKQASFNIREKYGLWKYGYYLEFKQQVIRFNL